MKSIFINGCLYINYKELDKKTVSAWHVDLFTFRTLFGTSGSSSFSWGSGAPRSHFRDGALFNISWPTRGLIQGNWDRHVSSYRKWKNCKTTLLAVFKPYFYSKILWLQDLIDSLTLFEIKWFIFQKFRDEEQILYRHSTTSTNHNSSQHECKTEPLINSF